MFDKFSGVGWDVHGYTEDPHAKAERQQELYDAHQKALEHAVGAFPERSSYERSNGLLGFLGLRPKKFDRRGYDADVEAWHERMHTYEANHPAPQNYGDYVDAQRVATPYDGLTNYKHNRWVGEHVKGLDALTSDWTYSDAPNLRNLSKADIPKVETLYQQGVKALLAKHPDDPYIQEDSAAFLNKLRALHNDPRVNLFRLEYE